jgi:hypothetical protein
MEWDGTSNDTALRAWVRPKRFDNPWMDTA